MTDTSRRALLALAAAGAPALAAGAASAQSRPSTRLDAAPPRAGAPRVALVTGSSRGIGAATARRLARDGYFVTVNYLTNAELAAGVVRSIEAAGGRAISRQADVADPSAVRSLFDANEQAFGGVDVVVSNAGIMNVAPMAQMTDQGFDRMIATNLKGSFNVLREAARRTRDGGRIIALASTSMTQKRATHGPYAATKAAQEMFAGSLAKELAGRRISVNAIAPGPTNTDLFRVPPQVRRMAAEQIPYGRIGEPEDVANVIAALCSGDGEWINGQLVFANGGFF
ncbi:SDR family oxidoreductase [Phenylobacterium deserti]|uniref:D-xylose 1-dehydrogenase n=1 Tax=Phenylobacterium deserti TaxID=1914756 RepID=A0A328AEP0_9CAUL|nr:SDR family oxidoreductase [Phenylobacterium deserti]RAK52676.1 3-oxoacyl-ACP reductase [Phenylobacterium deserti]